MLRAIAILALRVLVYWTVLNKSVAQVVRVLIQTQTLVVCSIACVIPLTAPEATPQGMTIFLSFVQKKIAVLMIPTHVVWRMRLVKTFLAQVAFRRRRILPPSIVEVKLVELLTHPDAAIRMLHVISMNVRMAIF
jgi:hypothetical protein